MPLPPLEPTGRISRQDLALNQWVWTTFVVVFGIVAASTAAIPVIWPSFGTTYLWPFAAQLAAVAIGAQLMGPPRIGSVRNHLTILTPPICTTLGIFAFAPHGVVPVAAAAFGGTFAASRLQSRRDLALHLAAGVAILALPLFFANVDAATTMAIIAMMPTVVALGICTALVLEAAEAQGTELQRLVRRDPLTAVGNQRHLDERLAYELERHARAGKSMTVLALDLNGFKEYNAALGRDAGDRLLQRVAMAIEAHVGQHDTVVRTGGDEFRILLPDTSWDVADVLLGGLRDAVAAAGEDGPAISTSIGVAVYPSDARDAEMLLEVADTRLGLEKYEMKRSRSLPDMWEPTVVPAPVLESETTEPRLDTVGGLTQVSRAAIAVNPTVWLVTGAMYLLFTVLIGAAFLFFGWAGYDGIAFCAAMGAVTATILLREPPAMDSWLNQAVVATPYVGCLLYILVAPDLAAGVLGPLAFAGPLTAVRLVNRRHIGMHYAVATVAILAFFAAGLVNVPVGLALALTIVVLWSVGFSDVLHLESADAQCAELDFLVRRDPVTGLGNRRFYAEQLDHEFRRSGRTRNPFSLLAIDLDDFAQVEELRGAGGGDALLRRVAAAVTEIAPAEATVIRRGGDLFCVLMPDTSLEQAQPFANALRVAIGKLSDDVGRVSAGVGVATYPTDATDGEVLRHVAVWRVREDKERRRGLPGGRRATDPPLQLPSDPATLAEPLQVFGRPAAVDATVFKRRGIRRRSA